jgi:hypothetical protein
MAGYRLVREVGGAMRADRIMTISRELHAKELPGT